jgi:hypothetical protein
VRREPRQKYNQNREDNGTNGKPALRFPFDEVKKSERPSLATRRHNRFLHCTLLQLPEAFSHNCEALSSGNFTGLLPRSSYANWHGVNNAFV